MKTCYVDKATRTIADLCVSSPHSGHIPKLRGFIITRINVPIKSRGQGHGSKILQCIVRDADRMQVVLHLEVFASGALSEKQLRAWYSRYGFENNGVVEGIMTRLPKREE